MRRSLFLFAVLLLTAQAAHAGGSVLKGRVFKYECDTIDPADTGFSCSLSKRGSHIVMNIDWLPASEQPPQGSEDDAYRSYRADALLIRYRDLGGRLFTMRTVDGHERSCQFEGRNYGLYCHD